MLEGMVPILYLSPSIINQIYAQINDGIVNAEEQTKKSAFGTSIKAIIETLFIPVKGEAAIDYEHSIEKTIHKTYDDLLRAIEIVQAMQDGVDLECALNKNTLFEKFSLLQGTFKLEVRYSPIDNSKLIRLRHIKDNYQFEGITSIDNWISKSLINQLVINEEFNASALVLPLSVSEQKITIKFACIYIL